jgi:antitoxin component YwqK of YwqJK toxin-antitoxin module
LLAMPLLWVKRIMLLFFAASAAHLCYAQEISFFENQETNHALSDTHFVRTVHETISEIPGEKAIESHNEQKTIFYKANIKNKKLHGDWQSWYANKTRRDSGRFVKGIPDGEWKVWDEEGRLLYLRQYSAHHYEALRHEVIRYHPKHSRYPLSDLHRTAPALYNYYTEPRRFLSSNSMNYLPVYKKGIHHGHFINYGSGGQVLDSGHYRYGLPVGVWRMAGENASYYIGHFENGRKEKEWKQYSAAGKLLRIRFYKADKLLWEKPFAQ